MPETLLLAFDGKMTYSFGHAEEHSFSVFGGPIDCNIRGKRSYRLHQIARLNHNHLPTLGAPTYVLDLPLIYGMYYSGGNLTYEFEHTDITSSMAPESSSLTGRTDIILPSFPTSRAPSQGEESRAGVSLRQNSQT
jgi:hypothetical protein